MNRRPDTPTKSQARTWTSHQWDTYDAKMRAFEAEQEEAEKNNPIALRARIDELERQVAILAAVMKKMVVAL